jgi:cell division protein FtsB
MAMAEEQRCSVFTIWMLFFDQNNVVDRIKMTTEINQLEEDREFYLEQIQKDSARLSELTTNKENLEKYAREQFLMKKNNEEVFVVVEEKDKRERKKQAKKTK